MIEIVLIDDHYFFFDNIELQLLKTGSTTHHSTCKKVLLQMNKVINESMEETLFTVV